MFEDKRHYLRISALLHGASLLIRDATRLSLEIGRRHTLDGDPQQGFNYRLNLTKREVESRIAESDVLASDSSRGDSPDSSGRQRGR